MFFFFDPANEQESSLSLSKQFDSDKELLHPIFSLSKKFDSDKELLHPIISLSKKFDSDKESLLYFHCRKSSTVTMKDSLTQ
jgi:hypothetical protein